MTDEHSWAAEILSRPFPLPCGVTLPNRIVKAAMTEQLSDPHNAPTEDLVRLYERWGRGGTGVLLTGNVMVDRRALEGPRNVALEDDRDLPMLRRWAEAAQAHGAQLWMQISHPGKQTPKGVSSEVVAPSAIPVKGAFGLLMAHPREITPPEIEAIIQRFANTAALAKAAGFAGVQVHAAHGYLQSQFLSPRANQRTDDWGGTPEKRRRLLLQTLRATRRAVGPAFPIALKLNSADFQRGGYAEDEACGVIAALAGEGVDLIEISGGNYENPVLITTGEVIAKQRDSTLRREAFFLEFAMKARGVTKIPLLLTGGLRTATTMARIIEEGHVDCVGLARPLALDPDWSAKLLRGEPAPAPNALRPTGIRTVDNLLQSLWHQDQMRRMARGLEPDPHLARFPSLAKGMYNTLVRK